jgi:hypothetical protein
VDTLQGKEDGVCFDTKAAPIHLDGVARVLLFIAEMYMSVLMFACEYWELVCTGLGILHMYVLYSEYATFLDELGFQCVFNKVSC